MIYEHRTYTCTPGSRDKLRARFDQHARHLFVKHGIEVIAFFENPAHETGQFIYICRFADEQAMEHAWENFSADPEWHAVKAVTEADGALWETIESQLLVGVEFLPVKVSA
ncbi:MAG: NIPSNAP family protein [Tumebacillaceae bacterium]